MKKQKLLRHRWCLCAVVGLSMALFSTPAHAASLTASNAAELIAAINTANGNGEEDTITLAEGVSFTLTAADNSDASFGSNGLPKITTRMTIEGGGATIERDSSAAKFRIFYVDDGGDLTLRSLTARGGYADGGLLNQGGCILVNYGTGGTAAALSLSDVTVSGCTSTNGGGAIANRRGTVTILDSTLSDNTNITNLKGGGIYGASVGTTTIKNSTLSGNTCTSCDGGGVANFTGTTIDIVNATISGNTAASGAGLATSGTVTVKNSIVSGNTGGNCLNSAGTLTSGGYNIDDANTCSFASTGDLASTDPLLNTAGLADNGGSTKTIALQSASPAIDAGDSSSCTGDTEKDQRGAARKGNCDIGAYEFACGNSVTDPGELCDDGNAVDDDRCSNTCQGGTTCGDGVIQTNFGEECDNGASNSDTEANACRSTCRNPSCGDSVIDEGQSCDDGNATDGDGCSSSCASESAATTPAASSGGCSLTAGGNKTFSFALSGIVALIPVTAIFVSKRKRLKARDSR